MKKYKIFLIISFAMFIGINVKAEDACYFCGGTNAATYYWAAQNPNPNNCNKDTTKTQAECKGTSSSAACYYCGSKNNWSYRWALRSPDPDNCKKVDDKTQSECTGSYQSEDYVETVSCPGIDEIPAGLPGFVRNIVNLMKIAIPILIIIMGMIDFVKAVTFTGDPKDPPFKKFFRRLIAGVLAFFIVALVQFVFGLAKDSDTNIAGCISCFISTEDACTHSWRGNNDNNVSGNKKNSTNTKANNDANTNTEDNQNNKDNDTVKKKCEDYTTYEINVNPCKDKDEYGNACTYSKLNLLNGDTMYQCKTK